MADLQLVICHRNPTPKKTLQFNNFIILASKFITTEKILNMSWPVNFKKGYIPGKKRKPDELKKSRLGH